MPAGMELPESVVFAHIPETVLSDLADEILWQRLVVGNLKEALGSLVLFQFLAKWLQRRRRWLRNTYTRFGVATRRERLSAVPVDGSMLMITAISSATPELKAPPDLAVLRESVYNGRPHQDTMGAQAGTRPRLLGEIAQLKIRGNRSISPSMLELERQPPCVAHCKLQVPKQ